MRTQLYDITNWPKLGLDKTKYPLIGTVDAAPQIGRVLDVAGQQFEVGILNPKEGVPVFDLSPPNWTPPRSRGSLNRISSALTAETSTGTLLSAAMRIQRSAKCVAGPSTISALSPSSTQLSP